jgi:glycosyltransferase involved in cell wall biosynthesis
MELLKLNEEKLQVIYLGVEESYFQRRKPEEIEALKMKYSLGNNYLLTMISRKPHKNPGVLIDAFIKLRERKGPDLTLVLAGLVDEQLRESVQGGRCCEKIKFLHYVPDSELPLLFQGAKIFVFPSIYEGFGLPVLEAMASGVPVLSSNATSLPEVIGEAGIYFNPSNRDELVQKLVDLLENEDLQRVLSKAGEKQARRFTWEACARKTHEVYCKVAGRI